MTERAIRIAVGGGKGGTGKSTVALSLGVALARLGMRTVLVDADLGAANLHTMMGIDRVPSSIQSLIDKDIATLEEVTIPTPEPRLALVPGVGAVVGGANPAHAQKMKVIRHIAALDADAIVIDVGAGVSYNVLDFFDLGYVRLLVTSPQLVSIQNAYAFLKNAVHRTLRAAAHDEDERRLLAGCTERSVATERLPDVLARVERARPTFAARLRAILRAFSTGIVANQVEPGTAGGVPRALARMIKDFLAMDASVLASLPDSASVHRSVTLREPHLRRMPHDAFSRQIMGLAERVLETDVAALRARRSLAGGESPRPLPCSHA